MRVSGGRPQSSHHTLHEDPQCQAGYRDGMMGMLRSYCFRPESETRGAEDGAPAGMRVWFRLMGRRTPERLDRSMADNAEEKGG